MQSAIYYTIPISRSILCKTKLQTTHTSYFKSNGYKTFQILLNFNCKIDLTGVNTIMGFFKNNVLRGCVSIMKTQWTKAVEITQLQESSFHCTHC